MKKWILVECKENNGKLKLHAYQPEVYKEDDHHDNGRILFDFGNICLDKQLAEKQAKELLDNYKDNELYNQLDWDIRISVIDICKASELPFDVEDIERLIAIYEAQDILAERRGEREKYKEKRKQLKQTLE